MDAGGKRQSSVPETESEMGRIRSSTTPASETAAIPRLANAQRGCLGKGRGGSVWFSEEEEEV